MKCEVCGGTKKNFKKAIHIERKNLNLVGKPADVFFRQTLNVKTKRWWCPKRMLENGRWKTIINRKLVTDTPQWKGNKFALWRLRDYMDRLHYTDGKKIWECSEIVKLRIYPYSYFYLKCKRIFHGIHGVM